MVNYPVMLKLENKHCVVVGGGTVATRKINSLLQASANVTVVSPTCSPEIKAWSIANQLHLKEKYFEKNDVNNAFLVIAATNSLEVNMKVYEAVNSHQLINIVDQPELCNFIVPTVLNRGKLSIAVSTAGSSPSLAQKIKKDLEEVFDDSYEQYIDFLDETRREIKAKIKDANVRYLLLKHLLDPIYLDLTRKGKFAERKKYFDDYLSRWDT